MKAIKIIEPHIHMYARTTDDYEQMKKTGIETVIEPAFWSGTDRSCTGSFYDYFEHLLNFEHLRAEKYGVRHYSFIGINPKEARNTKIAFEVIENMEKFLKHPNALGVGEIGFDKMEGSEEEVLRKQLRLAEKLKMPVIIHTAHTNKKKSTEKIVEIIKEEKLTLKRIIIDHNTEETIELSLSLPGVLCGITLYPTKMDVSRTISVIKNYGSERIIINSSADWGKSTPTYVAAAAHQMHVIGIPESDIENIIFNNAKKFFSQSPKFLKH